MRNYFFITFYFLLTCKIGLAQQIPQFNKKPYRDSTQKLYWNKHQPFYIMLSTSPSTKDAELLQSKYSQKYANPCYLDTEGINYIRTNWAVDKETKQTVYPQQQVRWEVYADGLAPITQTIFTSDKTYKSKELFYGKNTKVELKSSDQMSGVENTYYSINGSEYMKYTSPFIINKEAKNVLKYFSVDNVGNVETVKSACFNLDITTPSSESIISGLSLGDENIISKTTKIYIESTDEQSGLKSVYYRIDSMPEKKYTLKTTINIAEFPDGNHTLYFYGVDNAGNKETEQQFEFYLDKTAPITVSDILGDKFIVGDKIYFSGRTKMKITSVDNKAGVKEVLYSVNGSDFQEYKEPFYMPNQPGWHTVKYFATDNTSNITKNNITQDYPEYKMKIDKIYVDLTGPTINYSIQGDKYTRNDTVYIAPNSKITLSGSDKESGLKYISYSINGVLKETKYEKPFTLAQYPTGEHKIEIFGYDNVNNRNIDKIKVILDNLGPEINYKFSVRPLEVSTDGTETYPKGTDLFITVQDDITGITDIFYKINENEKKEYDKYISGFKKGLNTVEIEAYDKLKNKSEIIVKFKIK